MKNHAQRTDWVVALCLSALLGAACQSDTTGTEVESDNDLGVLQLHLTGQDGRGQQYRLRDADFVIRGFPGYDATPYTDTVSSEDDPRAAYIESRLVPGSYSVQLANRDWYLERVTRSGRQRVERAVLLSPDTQYAYVYDHGTSAVYFTFGADGEVIDFRSGTLRIGIRVELPDNDAGTEEDGGMDGEDAGYW